MTTARDTKERCNSSVTNMGRQTISETPTAWRNLDHLKTQSDASQSWRQQTYWYKPFVYLDHACQASCMRFGCVMLENSFVSID